MAKRKYVPTPAKYSGKRRRFARKRGVVIPRRKYKKTRGYKRVRRPRFVMYNKIVQEKVRTSLRYVDTKTISPGTTRAAHIFKINSLFDPDHTGVGHQPAYFDNWSALYGSYRVLSVKWKITFRPARASTFQTYTGATDVYPFVDTGHNDMVLNPGILFYELNDDAGTKFTEAADLNVLREIGGKMDNVGWRHSTVDPNRGYVMKGVTSINRLLDDPQKYNASSAVTADPSSLAYMHVGCMSKDGGTMSDYRFDIQLDFLVEFSDVKDVDEN